MEVKKIETKDAPGAIGPYSQAVVVGDFVYCSGQIPLCKDTGVILGTTASEQAKVCFKNIDGVLKAANASRVVKALVFLKDMNDFAAVNEVYAQYFASYDILPARSAVEVARLPKDVLVEIEVIAIK